MQARPLTVMGLVSYPGRGGAERLAYAVFAGLKRRGHRVIWACPADFIHRDEAMEAGIELFDLYPSGKRDMSAVGRLVRFCEEEKVDILNAHNSHCRHLLMRARIRGLGSKIVFTRHCLLDTVPLIGGFLYNYLADLNIAVSDAVRSSLLRAGVFRDRALTIYGGVEIKGFEDVPGPEVSRVRELYCRRGAFNIGVVARFETGQDFDPKRPTLKGHEHLFRSLAGMGVDINVLVLGPRKESDFDNLKALASHSGLDPGKLSYCGYQERIAPFYKVMDINVLPSPREGLGLAVIEGMAAGVSCIGADGGGIREIITDGEDGFLFRCADSLDLRDKIRALMLDRGLRRSFALRAKEKVREKFSLEAAVKKTEEAFYGLVEGGLKSNLRN